MPRNPNSPYVHDRAEIRAVLETQGRDAALARWPKHVVDPIARVLGLIPKYKNRNEWNQSWNPLLGTKPDSVLAGELNIPRSTVAAQRKLLGIPVYDVSVRRRQCGERLAGVLSQISDLELAGSLQPLQEKYNVSYAALAGERKRRGFSTRYRKAHIGDEDMRRVAVLAIADAYPSATHAEISRAVNLSRERVRQLLAFREVASA